MSYAKAMKHARNVRKVRKQARMYMGFDTGSGHWPNPRRNPEVAAMITIREWWPQRHDGDSQHGRECLREKIAELRELRR